MKHVQIDAIAKKRDDAADLGELVGAPVFLTKNGGGRYAILDMQDFEKIHATLRLMKELTKGRKSGEEKGWLTLEAVEVNFGIVNE